MDEDLLQELSILRQKAETKGPTQSSARVDFHIAVWNAWPDIVSALQQVNTDGN